MPRGHKKVKGATKVRCSCGRVIDARGLRMHMRKNPSYYVQVGPPRFSAQYPFKGIKCTPFADGDTMVVRFCTNCRLPVHKLDETPMYCPGCGWDINAVEQALAEATA